MSELDEKILCANGWLDSRLRETLDFGSPFDGLYQMMMYHLGWRDEKLFPRDGNAGKRIRSCLCFLACEAVGGKAESALPGALAVELIHNFSLVHDDIEDVSLVRRHRPTVWSIWGISHGVNVGDGLFALAHLALTGKDVPPPLRAPAVRALGEATVALCEGQFSDLTLESADKVDLHEYLMMIENKTAALFGCAAEIGGLLAGADTVTVTWLREFGRALGVAFQMQDDVLGVWGDEDHVGKAASDISDKKRGLPAVIAWESAEGDDFRYLSELYTSDTPIDPDERQRVLDIFMRLGVRERAESMVQERFLHAEEMLRKAVPAAEDAALLRKLMDRLALRFA